MTGCLGTTGPAIMFAVPVGGCSTLSGMRNVEVWVLIDHPPGIGVNGAKVVAGNLDPGDAP